jgi:lipopolysaccharide heptosyltransferase II
MNNSWAEAENVLCIRSDSLGDVLMTTPAIRAVKRSGEGRRVTLLTSSAGAAVASLIPEVDEVIGYNAPWGNLAAPRTDSRPEQEMIGQLGQRHFDAAIIFTVYSQNPLPAAMLCYLADIPLRLAHCRENPYQLLTDWLPEVEPEKRLRHEVRRQLDLVAAVGYQTENERLSLQVPPWTYGRVFALLAELGLNLDEPWVVIHPGVTAISRRYAPLNYARVARLLAQEHGWQVVFTGTEPEVGLVQGIREVMGAPSYSLVSRLDLAEMAALLSLSPLLITNNTGPAHMAAAVGTPVVDLYALTNPQHTPWQVPNRVLFHDVPCKYCYRSICPEGHHHCLRLVTPEAVVAAAVELAAETAGSVCKPMELICTP